MTANRRIFLNIIATYGRSLYALAIGLFTARWALEALGHVDYGLYGVVGGLAAFISFFNSLLAVGVGRFYAISVGKGSVKGSEGEGLDDCHKWFSTAVTLHLMLASVLMLIGYPVGAWAVKNFLTIPADRVADCVWVFRFVCITCFLGMVTVPINAMYTAKQYIAELTIYSFATTTANAVFLYYIVTHPAIWLRQFALWSCMLAVLPQVIITLRGCFIFKECRFKLRYAFSLTRLCQLTYYCGWTALGFGGSMLRNQGIQVLVNMYFGPRVNASMAVANNVNGHTTTLSGAMLGAFQPAIVNAYGAGDLERMRALAYRAGKFSILLIMLFTIPLSLELKEVLRLWLINPPQYVYGLCLVMFIMTIIDQSATGHMMAVNARGKIAKYQAFLGTSLLLTLPLAWIFCALGGNVYWIAVALLATMTFCALGRVWFARDLVGMSAWYWIKRIVAPAAVSGVICLAIGYIPQIFMAPSFIRIVVTTLFCEVSFIPLAYFVVLEPSERAHLASRLPFLRREAR